MRKSGRKVAIVYLYVTTTLLRAKDGSFAVERVGSASPLGGRGRIMTDEQTDLTKLCVWASGSFENTM
jgi:hypothetical protein